MKYVKNEELTPRHWRGLSHMLFQFRAQYPEIFNKGNSLRHKLFKEDVYFIMAVAFGGAISIGPGWTKNDYMLLTAAFYKDLWELYYIVERC